MLELLGLAMSLLSFVLFEIYGCAALSQSERRVLARRAVGVALQCKSSSVSADIPTACPLNLFTGAARNLIFAM